MKKIKFAVLIAAALMLFALTSCNDGNKDSGTEASSQSETGISQTSVKKEIKVGVSPNTGLIVEAAIPVMKEKGYDLKVVTFDDFVLPNTALVEKSIDCNLFQHKPFMDAFNKSNNTDLVFVNRVAVGTCNLYSNKYESLDALPNGAKVGIYQDASNQDRMIRLMLKNDLLKAESKDGLYTLLDITENPKNLEFVTLDINQLTGALNDLDASFETDTVLFLAGVKPNHSLLREETSDDYVLQFANGIVTRADDQNEPWVKDFVQSFKEESTKKTIIENFGGSYEPVADK